MKVTTPLKLCAFAMALLIHLLFLVSCATGNAPIGAAQDQGRDGLEVGVGLAGSFNESSPEIAQEEETNDDTSESTDTNEKKAPIEGAPEQDAKQTQAPEPAAPEMVKNQKVAVTFEEIVNSAIEAPSQTNNETPNVEPTTQKLPTAVQKQEAAENNENVKPERENTEAKTASIKATGTGTTQESGGNPAAEQNYLAKIQARLSKFKRYPRSARKENITGTVLIEFVLTRDGRIERPSIVRSSGDSRLDQEALDVLLRASPFPRIPKKLRKDSFALTLPVEFSLNQSRKLF